MANSTTNLDAISESQSGKATAANAAFDAMSQAATYGRRASTTSGLTWGYYGGNVIKTDGTLVQIANGTLTLTGSTTNYVVALKSTGAVSVSTATTNWNNQTDYWRLFSIVTGSATVTSWTDSRGGGWQHAGGGAMANPMTAAGDIIIGGTGGAPTRLAAGTNTYVLTLVGGVPTWAVAPGAASGEANTASNVGSGVGLFKQKASVDLEFKSMLAGPGLAVSGGTDEVSILARQSLNTQTASYTLVLGDAGKYVRMNVGSANNLTVPPNSSVAFTVGDTITVRQVGAGQTTVVAGSGVTITTPETLKLRKQHATVSLVKVATDTWELFGDLEAAP